MKFILSRYFVLVSGIKKNRAEKSSKFLEIWVCFVCLCIITKNRAKLLYIFIEIVDKDTFEKLVELQIYKVTQNKTRRKT